MCLFFAAIAYAIFAIFWAGTQAYYRKAIRRSRILVVALVVPFITWGCLLGVDKLMDRIGASFALSADALVAVLGAYFAASIATICWAYLAKVDSGLRGFPIKFAARKDSEQA